MSTEKRGTTLRELMDMKYDAEFRLMETINKEIREIRFQAGVSVQDIEIDLIDITQFNAKKRDYVIGKVNLVLDLEGEK